MVREKEFRGSAKWEDCIEQNLALRGALRHQIVSVSLFWAPFRVLPSA